MSLVVDNTKNAKEISYTCRNSCDLYDVLTESCSIKNKVDVDNPFVVSKCSSVNEHNISDTLFHINPGGNLK
ncbi:hypothetical protein ABW02_20500 [Niallia circulans]|uniref:Uncharacterized protein n=1 Tax=Niallia circulans TaxID=1397 RepID=A0A0J1IA83_NIACI|nr:hypothetical protein ABW02_20500 [Niallia circulans]SLL37140.1 Uncharacterised protein [Mycobacteroides abscessus subsp. abscessus]HEO8422218.1 hypothetical protein [Yersinia enterocolitica]